MSHYMRDGAGIFSEHELCFYGPEGRMTLEEAQAAGYEVRHWMGQGMAVNDAGLLAQIGRAAAMSNYPTAFEREAQMQNSPALRYAKSQEPGGIQGGPAKHMGVPCMLPRMGWRERLRQWWRR